MSNTVNLRRSRNLKPPKNLISIIISIHNCLAYKDIFWESLKKYPYFPQQFIIINSHSTDGSQVLFKSAGCQIINSEYNLDDPESANLGLTYVEGNFICQILMFCVGSIGINISLKVWQRYMNEVWIAL